MPVHELKEVLKGTVVIEANGQGYLTKRINIPETMRNKILTIDVFNDQGTSFGNLNPEPSPNGQQFFITPFPPQKTDENWGHQGKLMQNSGPMAGDLQVLYKESTIGGNGDLQDRGYEDIVEQFPNDSVGARPTQSWYTPTLYLTMMVWNLPEAIVPIQYSVYIRVDQKKVSRLESAMGGYAEMLDAQCRLLTSTGVMVGTDRLAGQTFPMWKFGGIRSELMVSSAVAAQYFNRIASSDAEVMQTIESFQTRFGEATEMVAFDEGFGSAIIPTPQWVRILNVAGVTSGTIRPQAPPLKFNDDGTTQML
ncbi:MAG: hypothetical protein [Circular genetic element sp.]|nr:MAG: hypothetical protein [Circular genetic element sp.]